MTASLNDKRKGFTSGKAVPLAAEPMSLIDRSWLRMDSEHNPMVVASIMELENVRSGVALRLEMAERLRKYSRFRQHVGAIGHIPTWVSDGEFDANYHLHIQKLGKGDRYSLIRLFVANEIAQPLDPARPLWKITFFTGLPDRKVLVFFRAHHAMADGVALLRLMVNLADGKMAAMPGCPPTAGDSPEQDQGPLASVIRRLTVVNRGMKQLRTLANAVLEDPSAMLPQLSTVATGLASLARVVSLPDDNPKCLRVDLSGERIVDWSRPLPLDAVHAVARRRGVSLNDLFLATLAGAIGRHLRELGPLVRSQNLRISIPVNLRSSDTEEFGNCFGLVLLDLPIGEQNAKRRLQLVRQRMLRLKLSGEAKALLLILKGIGQLPVALETRLVNSVAHKAAAVVSNLPGPKEPLYFNGSRLSNMVFWPPQTGSVGIGISIISYAGSVTVGLCCDRAVLDRPAQVIKDFETEMANALHT